jgi:hypothetical protein
MALLNKLAYDPTKEAHASSLVALKVACGQEVSEEEMKTMRGYDAHLPPNMKAVFPLDAGKIDLFWGYFQGWLNGAISVPENWAMWHRLDNGQGVVAKSTNNAAEGLFSRMSASRKHEPNSESLPEYVRWLESFIVLKNIVPDVLRKSSW